MSTNSRNSDPDTTALDVQALSRDLIEHLKTNGTLKSQEVAEAFHAVPRHLFLPGYPLESVYSDQAILTKLEDNRAISSSSQPSIMAIMLEQLDLRPGQRVLEIGAGTGYNAAIMAELVGEGGEVTTIDIAEDICDQARSRLQAANFERVRVICGDGMKGYEAGAPYDRIILTVGGWDITPEWLSQLMPKGRIVLPLSINGPQLSVAFDREDDHLTSVSIAACGFMRLRGELAEPQSDMPLNDEANLSLEFNGDPPDVDAKTVARWLNERPQVRKTGVAVTMQEVWGNLAIWQALQEGSRCLLVAQGNAIESGPIPFLFGRDGQQRFRMTPTRISAKGISVLSHPLGESIPLELVCDFGKALPSFELYVRSYGSDEPLATAMVAAIRAWAEAGRPGEPGLRIRAYPVDRDYRVGAGEYKVRRCWHDHIIDWPSD
jgi:protein-L-isoaspartate(D-aspartate) O-methyltransferase